MTDQGTVSNQGTAPLFLCKNGEAECRLCPRNCGVDRTAGHKGFCGQDSRIIVGRAALHMWEEPCISGSSGSGTVFFSGCNLRCVFCQNKDLSRASKGIEVSVGRLADIFVELQDKNANNINLVTPTHYVPQIISALELARNRGLRLPVVWNCGGYESVDTLRMLEGYVDVWLPDFKYKSDELAMRYSGAGDYFERASAAIAEMVRQTRGQCVFDKNGIMTRGVIVRHLVLPGQTADSKRVLRYLHETYGDKIYISIMSQFTPVTDLTDYPEINRTLMEEEYNRVTEFATRIGIQNGFIQQGETAKESFIPAFDGEGVLPAGQSDRTEII